MPKHEREQPNDALDAGRVDELRAEVGEVDLGLAARRRLEAHLEARGWAGPNLAQELFDRGAAAAVADVADLAVQPGAGQLGISGNALAQIRLEQGLGRAGLARPVGWRLKASRHVFAHGLPVQAGPLRDGRHA